MSCSVVRGTASSKHMSSSFSRISIRSQRSFHLRGATTLWLPLCSIHPSLSRIFSASRSGVLLTSRIFEKLLSLITVPGPICPLMISCFSSRYTLSLYDSFFSIFAMLFSNEAIPGTDLSCIWYTMTPVNQSYQPHTGTATLIFKNFSFPEAAASGTQSGTAAIKDISDLHAAVPVIFGTVYSSVMPAGSSAVSSAASPEAPAASASSGSTSSISSRMSRTAGSSSVMTGSSSGDGVTSVSSFTLL